MTDGKADIPRTPLFDARALALHRHRATALFLREAVADDVEDRIALVNRRFTAPAIITPFPQVWRARRPEATILPVAEVLALSPAAHDLVLHDLALHWAEDPAGQLVQCRLALRPDGLFVGTLFAGQTLSALRGALAAAEVAVTGGLSPRVAPMADLRDLGGLLQRAGLALPVADLTPYEVTHADALALMHDLRAMGEGNALAGRLRRPTRRQVILEAARRLAESAGADGRIRTRFEVATLTGWAPAPGQPRPLRPGSATHRLAEALGSIEQKLDPAPD